MMVRGAVISHVGGLDEGYFMYCEEMDWCLRMAEAGYQTYVVPAAHFIHFAGQSSRQVRWTAYEHLWKSRFRFFSKHSHRYPCGYRQVLSVLVWWGHQVQERSARARFARGEITGVEVAQELAAYLYISRLRRRFCAKGLMCNLEAGRSHSHER